MSEEIDTDLLEEYIQAKISFSRSRIEQMERSLLTLKSAYDTKGLYTCRRMLETFQNDLESALGAIESAITLQRFVDCPQGVALFIARQKEVDREREERNRAE